MPGGDKNTLFSGRVNGDINTPRPKEAITLGFLENWQSQDIAIKGHCLSKVSGRDHDILNNNFHFGLFYSLEGG
jgi:hypothetical protein